MQLVLSGLILILVSYLGTFLMVRKSVEIGLVDTPNERSSHDRVVPKGGGLVFSWVSLPTLLGLYVFEVVNMLAILPVLIAGPLLYFLGWLDDRIDISPLLRLCFQVFVCSGLVIFIFVSYDGEPHYLFLPPWNWLNGIFAVLYLSWFINLYNFMDGADGIAGGGGALGAAALGVFMFIGGAEEMAIIYWVVACALLGFVYFNWSPAKIFMGDAGAYFLGSFFAVMSLVAKAQFDIPLYLTIIVFGLFIVDATYTTLMRFLRGRNPLKAHREFAFHKLIARGWNHRRVACLYLLIILLWLVPLAYLSMLRSGQELLILVIAYLPLLLFEYFVGAAKE